MIGVIISVGLLVIIALLFGYMMGRASLIPVEEEEEEHGVD